MNDRAAGLLENYELNIQRTYKGRGCILCETDRGLKIFREFQAPHHKVILMEALFRNITEMNLVDVDTPVATRDGAYLVKDRDGVSYILKDYYEGRECSLKNFDELCACMRTMALLHTGMYCPKEISLDMISRFDLVNEVLRHNMLLRKIRKYTRERGSKTPFERFLISEYDRYLGQAERVLQRLHKENFESFYDKVEKERSFIHGDFQYHNVLLCEKRYAVVNFERCRFDGRVGDIVLFLRKIMEKYDWEPTAGIKLLQEYETFSPLGEQERRQLFYRLAYPEKFRKIVSAYYNSNKAFQSQVYSEKLEKVCRQEEKRLKFLSTVFDDVVE